MRPRAVLSLAFIALMVGAPAARAQSPDAGGAPPPGTSAGEAQGQSPDVARAADYLTDGAEAVAAPTAGPAAVYVQNAAAVWAAPTTSWVQTVDPGEGAGAFGSKEGPAAATAPDAGTASMSQLSDAGASSSGTMALVEEGGPFADTGMAPAASPAVPPSATAVPTPSASAASSVEQPPPAIHLSRNPSPNPQLASASGARTAVGPALSASAPNAPSSAQWFFALLAGTAMGGALLALRARLRTRRLRSTERSVRPIGPPGPRLPR